MSSECKASTCMANDLWLPSPTAPNIKVNVRTYHDLSDYLNDSGFKKRVAKFVQHLPTSPPPLWRALQQSHGCQDFVQRYHWPSKCPATRTAAKASSGSFGRSDYLIYPERMEGSQEKFFHTSHLNFACPVHMSLLLMYAYIILYH